MKTNIHDLLVTYVNGTASADESQRVRESLQRDPELAAEARFLESLRDAAKVSAGAKPGEYGIDRLRRSLGRYRIEQQRLRFWRGLTALCAVLALALGAFALLTPSDSPDRYRPLQGSSSATLQVRFQPHATSAQVQELFRSLSLEVVSGPSAVGVYRLRTIAQAHPYRSPLTPADALARLHEQDGLIEFAALDP